MRLFRIPMSSLMLAVLFVALNCAILRNFLDHSNSSTYLGLIIPTLVPLASFLVFQWVVVTLRLWRRGRVLVSFLVGFQCASWAAIGLLIGAGFNDSTNLIDSYSDGAEELISFMFSDQIFQQSD